MMGGCSGEEWEGEREFVYYGAGCEGAEHRATVGEDRLKFAGSIGLPTFKSAKSGT